MSEPSPVAWHRPVMVEPVLASLHPRRGAVVVDATIGTGGHSLAILPRLLPDGRLIAVDRDGAALAVARQRLAEFAPLVTFIHDDFRNLPHILQGVGIAQVDGVLLDLGMSGVQVDQPERGFSFSHEGPLDMRMDPEQETTAETLIQRSSADELAWMLQAYGEERFATRIAQQIVKERRTRAITTTVQLARVVSRAVPPGARHGRLHPATRTFQALRIAVNDELGALEELLGSLHKTLRPGARAVVITFHSLEDRLVKRAFSDGGRRGLWTVLTKKPVRPSAAEVADNPRARSAKLRAVERGPSR